MPKRSAGIILFRQATGGIELLLVHPGGPFWARKDVGAWSVPKGEYAEDEPALEAARREFQEETGFAAPSGEPLELGDVQYSNKIITVWALQGSIDARRVHSNTFTMEWPPKTGRTQEFPEVDRAGWFTPPQAKQKLVKGQVELVDRLCAALGVDSAGADEPPQLSLL